MSQLFDPGPAPDVDAAMANRSDGKLSADQRRTIKRRRLLELGINPATRRPFRVPLGETCGSCAHHRAARAGNSRFHKCDLNRSSSAATDIRVSWPACDLWKPA